MAKFLKSYNRDCAGTVKANRKVMPKKLQESKLQNGDAAEQQDGPESVLAMAWQGTDNNDLSVSCSWSPGGVEGGEKPVCVIHYNQQMGRADKEDQLLKMYLVQGKK